MTSVFVESFFQQLDEQDAKFEALLDEMKEFLPTDYPHEGQSLDIAELAREKPST